MKSGYGIESIILLIVYLLFLLFVGLRLFKIVKPEAEEYLLMGRRLSMPAFVATLVSTWYGGILGVGEYSYKHGLSNWVIFGLPYYLAALIFALFIAKRAQATKVLTIPDQLEKVYGKNVAIVGALFVFLNAIPGAYVLQIGVLANSVFGIPMVLAVILGAAFSIFYIFSGGLKGDVFTDIIQFFLMFLGFGIMLAVLVYQNGFWPFLSANLPDISLTWHGGKPLSYILVWYFIALATLIEPSFYQRCFAARTGNIARNGILISIGFWVLFDFLTTFTGMYSRALMPDLSDPVSSYPSLGAKVLPPLFQGVFLLGLFATVMSTVDSYTLIAGTTIGKDIFGRLKKNVISESREITVYTKIGLVISGITAIAIALFFRSVIDIWYNLGTITTAALLIPLASSFSKKFVMNAKIAMASMILSTLVVLAWIIPNLAFGVPYHFGIDPIYPGILTSLIFMSINRLAALRKNMN